MQLTKGKEKETHLLNIILALLAVGSLLLAGYVLATGKFKGGTDDLFLIMVCLLAALLFAIVPFMWAYEQGYVAQFLDVGDEGEAAAAHAHRTRTTSTGSRTSRTSWSGARCSR